MMEIKRSQLGWLIILLASSSNKTNSMLNLSTRQHGNEGIFSQSLADINPRKNRLLASTGFSNLNNSMQTTRLPQLSRSFSSSKSTKLKLTTIQATLSAMSQQLHELRLDTRQSRRYCNFLKDDLGESHLGSTKLDLTTQANKLEKMFKISKKHDEDRSRAIKQDCDKLRESTHNLKNTMALLQSKVDNCQNVMGIYSGKEKHRQ